MTKDKPASPGTASPALPPQPLLPVPASKIPQRPQAAQLIAGLAAPSQGAQMARRLAASSRDAINRHVQAGRVLVAQLKEALKQCDASRENAAEWEREGVDIAAVREFLQHEETLLSQFTAK